MVLLERHGEDVGEEWQQWRLKECSAAEGDRPSAAFHWDDIQQFFGRENALILHSSPEVEDVFQGISRLMLLESGILLVTRAVLWIGQRGGGGERILKVDYSAAEYVSI